MKRIITALVVGALAFGGGAALLAGTAAATPPNPDHKVTLCHRTGSATNPYIVITTDIASDGYVKGGHDQHEQVGNGLGGDIIPAYEYVAKDGTVFDYPGKNLDFVFANGETGAEVLAAGCVLTDSTPTPTPTPAVINPAASIEGITCKDLTSTVTLDNSGSTDGSDESATVTFDVSVDGKSVGTFEVAAGDVATVDVGPLDGGQLIEVTAGDATLASLTTEISGCGAGGDDNPPPTGGGNPKPPTAPTATPPVLAETL